ncbi:MAG: bifunctional folylpolyglutamate synthase/dihydrofolate synthase [Firmicutes bacterium]|nr:bifunctional folylpolyglutamate synthase/dihydrofolate synthase [Bacillota bacterium]
MNSDEAIKYIHSVSWTGSRPGLFRIRELCHRLGDPQRELQFVHVAGTNGKGSFCAMLASILSKSGYKTGLFTSPYVTDFCERMTVDGVKITGDELASIIENIRPIADSMKPRPTEFELITVAAFEFFRKKACDIVVLEVGLGGRLDSTNIIDPPTLSVITEISLDHTAILGSTVEKIAKEKAGIIKYPSPVLFTGTDPSALDVIKSEADTLGCEFCTPDYGALKIKKISVCGSRFDYNGYNDMSVPLAGLYQPRNAAAVIEAAELLTSRGYNISESSIREGLSSVVWHARFELLSRCPVVIYDGGHNPGGVAAAAASLRALFPDTKVTALSGVMEDKDYKASAAAAAPCIAHIYTVKPDSPRALDAYKYAEAFVHENVDSTPCAGLGEGVRLAVADAIKHSRPLYIFGSLYMYADVKRELGGIIELI